MELQQLRYFHEVARTQHVTNSAKKLNVAQPALTQSIRRLERELGVPLLERVGRNVRLTACGEALEQRIGVVLATLDELPEELATVAGREQATVRLAIESASGLAVDAIAAYRAAHPAARFVVSQETSARRWDLRVRTVRTRQQRVGGEENDDRRFDERIGIAVPAERALSGALALTDLAEEPFICLAGSRAFRAVCDEACAQAGFAPRVTFESDSPAVVKNMIGLGLGVGFWPERSWGNLEDGSARLVGLAEPQFARTIEIASAAGPLNEEAAEFRGFLISFFEERWREPSPLGA